MNVMAHGLAACLVALGGCCSFAQASGEVPTFPIDEVIAEVKTELAAAQNKAGAEAGLELDKVTLQFALTRSVDVNGKITVGVPIWGGNVSAGGDRKSENTSTLSIDLVPPKGTVTMSGSDIGNLGLTNAILDVRRQLAAGMNQPPMLSPSNVMITLKFVVTKSGSAGVGAKYLVVSADLGGSLSAAQTNSISLTFVSRKAP